MAAMIGLLLAGCVGGAPVIIPAPSSNASRVPGTPTPAPPLRLPSVQQDEALGLVIGASAGRLTRLFGQAQIDLIEGDARKLQFANDACVLDVFLYPTQTSRTPVATHVDARRPQNGAEVDRGACIAALRR